MNKLITLNYLYYERNEMAFKVLLLKRKVKRLEHIIKEQESYESVSRNS